ncbi:MAG: integrase family protein [Pseudomonadota bacterium]
MAKVNLTAGRIADHQCEEGKTQCFLWCAEVPGLGVRATSGSNRKRYIFQAKVKGQSMRITIGDVSAWSIPAAQKEARRLQILIDQGNDPRQVKEEQAAAKEAAILDNEMKAANQALQTTRESVTLGMAWPIYLEAKAPKWSARHLLDHQRVIAAGGISKAKGEGVTVAGVLSPLSSVSLCDLTSDRVTEWLNSPDTIRRPTQARRAFTLLRAFIGWCSTKKDFKGIIPSGACASHVAKDVLPKPAAKDDCLQREQLPLWFEHVRKLTNPVHAAYLQGLLLTGARREELAALKWGDVDFQWNSLSIQDKVEGSRIIPLTPYLAQLLAALPRRNQWVFSSHTAKSGRLQEPRYPHNKALTAAGLPALSLHGLRRSFGTLAEWCEVPTGVVAQIMGHKPSALAEKHYRRRPLDLLRMWHVKIEAWILEQAGIEFVPVAPGLRVVKQ